MGGGEEATLTFVMHSFLPVPSTVLGGSLQEEDPALSLRRSQDNGKMDVRGYSGSGPRLSVTCANG